MRISVVIPTIREKSIKKFFKEWNFPKDWEIIVVEDNPKKTFSLPRRVKHYCWKDIDRDLGKDAWIISRRNAGIRCYGFLKAKGDVIITLDDDCYPAEGTENYITKHLENLVKQRNIERWTSSCGTESRGYPYKNSNSYTKTVISHGLWLENPDLDAIQTLMQKEVNELIIGYILSGFYYPMCSMNLAFKKEVLPLMYFPLMGKDQPFDRFDDIWAGILSKKVLDHLGLNVYSGRPYIKHIRASDPISNLVKEAPGIEVNEWFWKVVDNVQLKHTEISECYCDLSDKLNFSDIIMSEEQRKYFKKLKQAMKIWAYLCQKYQ